MCRSSMWSFEFRTRGNPALPTGRLRTQSQITPRRRTPSSPLKPRRQPFHRLGDIRRRARIAEADEASPVHRIEIRAGGRGHARFLQHVAGEIAAIAAKKGNAGAGIETAHYGEELPNSSTPQAPQR